MAERKPYIATDTTEPNGSVGVGDALSPEESGGAALSQEGLGEEEEPVVPAHGAAGVAVGAYVGAIARRVLWRYAWWLVVPAAVACFGLYDWRYAVIALMLLLLVFPMVVTIAVFNHGMHPAVVRRTRAETVELTAVGDGGSSPSAIGALAAAAAALTVRDADGAIILTIRRDQIRRVHTDRGRTTIAFGPNPADILILQSTALPAAALSFMPSNGPYE